MKNLKRNLLISFLVLLAGAGILTYSLTHQRQEISMNVASNELDQGSKSDLCNAMWLKSDCNIAKDLPSEVQKNLELMVNKPEGLGRNTADMINDVGTSFLPFVKRYPERYSDLIKISQKGLSPTQVYNIPGVKQ
ncbi:MAG: hypothetical protein M1338_02245 [Patescibacteria group bacterium]|nr:hypothetical protein [Patescibacteria group bacterium]